MCLLNNVEVIDDVDAVVNGQSQYGSDHDSASLYSTYSDEIYLSDVKNYKLTSDNEYFSSVVGKSVDHLCDVDLTTQDLQKTQQITT